MILLALFSFAAPAFAADPPAPQPQKYTHQVTGLFSPDRVEDLRLAMADVPNIKLVSVDYDKAEAVFEYDPKQLFNTTRPDQIVERLDNLVRSKSSSTFGVRLPSSTPPEKLVLVEIDVVGLDCKGCCWAAYQSVARSEGVDRAYASFKLGKVSCWIDPSETNRDLLEAALKRRGVTLASEVQK